MSPTIDSPFSARFRQKVEAGMEGWKFSRLTRADFRMLQRAFVEALKEEVEARFGNAEAMKTPFATINKPLRIAGLGSFKMRTRPTRKFDDPNGRSGIDKVTKPPSRRLIFTAKWEPLP